MPFPDFPDPLKPKRTGTRFAFEEIDGAEELKGYAEISVDLPKLIETISGALKYDLIFKDFYYKNYLTRLEVNFTDSFGREVTSPVQSVLGPGNKKMEPVSKPIVLNEGGKREEVVYTVRASLRPPRNLDPVPLYRIDINLDQVACRYIAEFAFVEGSPKLEKDEMIIVERVDGDFKVVGRSPERIRAITFTTGNVDHYLLLNKKLNNHWRDFEGFIIHEFSKVYEKLDKKDYRKVSHFYEQAPPLFLSTLSLDTLIWDAAIILQYDKETWLIDNSNVMIKTLGVIMGIDGGTSRLYQLFNGYPRAVKEIYYNLDKNGRSVLYDGREVPHKTIFATMLIMICNDQGQGYNPERLKTHITFDITKGHKVDSNIISGDTEADKYNLTQQTLLSYRGPLIEGSNSIDVDKYEWVAAETQYLHPLDMVTLILEGPNGEARTMIVPAIYVKDQAYHQEWGEVMKIIRLVVNIFIIIVSIATLVSGPGAFMLAVSIIDLGLATADIVIQSFADEIAKQEGGQEFLDLWESIYLVGGIVTAVPFVGALLKSGGRLLLKAVSAETRSQLVLMLKFALQGAKNFPKFVKGQFDIVLNFVEELGTLAGTRMNTLAKEGVMLLKGVVEGEGVAKYYLSFRNAIIRSGTLQEIKDAISKKFRQGKDDLGRYLNNAVKEVWGDGIYRGKILTDNEITAWRNKLLKEYGTTLKKVKKFEEPDTLATFDPNTNTIYYKESVTEYLMAHESYHAMDMHRLGFDEFVKGSALKGTKWPDEYSAANHIAVYKHEKYVFDQIMKNAEKHGLNAEELFHARHYFEVYAYELKIRNIPIPK